MQLTNRERFARTYAHKESDRVPIMDYPWETTLKRWKKEGMPENLNFCTYADYFGTDKIDFVDLDLSPRYEVRVIEENDEFILTSTGWGTILKNFKNATSTPEVEEFKIKEYQDWVEAKLRMDINEFRPNIEQVKAFCDDRRAQDIWTEAHFQFGFNHAFMSVLGLTEFLMMMYTEPEWAEDIFSHCLDMSIANFTRVWDAGCRFDSIMWSDDMGFKGTSFFSPEVYRDHLMPYHKKAVDWAHERGLPAHLHTCGNVMGLMDDICSTGMDSIDPLEIKAGMEPLTIKEKYGNQLTIRGGLNAMLWDKPQEIHDAIAEIVPKMKVDGGYIFSSDHSIPDNVSLSDYKEIVRLAKVYGAY